MGYATNAVKKLAFYILERWSFVTAIAIYQEKINYMTAKAAERLFY